MAARFLVWWLAMQWAVPLAAQVDWPKEVDKACSHPRLGVRLAVAKKIAGAGDAAIPALQAWIGARGSAAVPLELVEALANSTTPSEQTVALLSEWAGNREFFWRAPALGGLARRQLATHRATFRAALRDPFHLYRLEGARGLWLLGPGEDRVAAEALLGTDEDLRLRIRLAAFLVEQGQAQHAPWLLAALAFDAEFLGEPWAAREATAALTSLKALTGSDHGFKPGLPAEQNRDALVALRTAVRAKLGEFTEPRLPQSNLTFTGGVAIRSCRSGDWFVRWTQEGQVALGLTPATTISLPVSSWQALQADLPAGGNHVLGTVVCDHFELCQSPTDRLRIGPQAMPDAALAWVQGLAAALGEAGDGLRARLEQFAPGAGK